MRRPLILVALWYISGVLAGNYLAAPLFFLLVSAISFSLAALFWTRARPILIVPAIFLAGWVNVQAHTAATSPYDLRRIIGVGPELATFRGSLRETPSYRVFMQDQKESWRTLCQLELTETRLNRREWQPAVGRLAVMTPGLLTNYFAGQTVEITGVAHLPKMAAAEGTFDYRSYLKQLGIYYQLDAGSEQDWQVLSSPSHRPLADRFRDWARAALAQGLPVEDEALRLEWALTLGWKPALTEEVSEPFVRAATYHIFAVDGLRMAIIFGIFFSLLRALSVPRAMCGLLRMALT